MKNVDNTYVIFKRSVANTLLEKGFKLVKIEEKKNDGRRSVFLFECTPNLIEFMNDLKKEIDEMKSKR